MEPAGPYATDAKGMLAAAGMIAASGDFRGVMRLDAEINRLTLLQPDGFQGPDGVQPRQAARQRQILERHRLARHAGLRSAEVFTYVNA